MSTAGYAMTLWKLVEALAGWNPATGPQGLQAILGSPVEVARQNEYWVRYQPREAVALDGGASALATISQNKATQTYSGIGLAVAGGCVSLAQLKANVRGVEPESPPASPAPVAEAYWRAQVDGVPVSFGFRNDNPDCISSVALHLDRAR